jgi:hypothetical protein
VDFSLPLLREVDSLPQSFPARFLQADLTDTTRISDRLSIPGNWSVVTAFAVLHHIPSRDLRLKILKTIHGLLKPDGMFIHSNWQFLNSDKLKARIQPWEAAAISESDVDAGDYLLDWRGGGEGLRYVHHFDEEELDELAGAAAFRISETFHSDGNGGRLGLYQIWKPGSQPSFVRITAVTGSKQMF